ncbi:unnamed protein product [Mucor hiemalis]
MKFTLAAAAVFLFAITVNAKNPLYHFKFDTVEGALSCQDKNADYINNITEYHEVQDGHIFMILKSSDCDLAIAQTFNETCGGIESSECE